MPDPQLHRFDTADFEQVVAHDGEGEIAAARVHACAPFAGASWVDLVVVPAGHTIGLHRHSLQDEEIYVVVDGSATMQVDGAEVAVGPGDVLVNRPGGEHGLVNTGALPLRLVVVDVAVQDGRAPH